MKMLIAFLGGILLSGCAAIDPDSDGEVQLQLAEYRQCLQSIIDPLREKVELKTDWVLREARLACETKATSLRQSVVRNFMRSTAVRLAEISEAAKINRAISYGESYVSEQRKAYFASAAQRLDQARAVSR